MACGSCRKSSRMIPAREVNSAKGLPKMDRNNQQVSTSGSTGNQRSRITNLQYTVPKR